MFRPPRLQGLVFFYAPCRWAAHVTYRHDGKTYIASHLAMPFGATSSVEEWERVGDLILQVARELLHMPLFRYVDDYFGPER